MRAPHVGIATLLLCGCPTPSAPNLDEPAKAEPSPVAQPEPTQASTPEPTPLSQEDLDLIAADPASLSPDDRRKRAYALRRKIMQNPDSPAARTLEDLRKAHEDGLLELPAKQGGGVVLTLPGTTPAKGPPPAGARPDDAAP